MFEVKNFLNNSNIGVLQEKGQFTVIEHYSDISVSPGEAAVQFYMTQMKVRRRQLVCDLLKDPQAGVTLQAAQCNGWLAMFHVLQASRAPGPRI